MDSKGDATHLDPRHPRSTEEPKPDVLTIYNTDGSTTEVENPFGAMKLERARIEAEADATYYPLPEPPKSEGE